MERVRARVKGAGLGVLAGMFSLVCGWAFADGGAGEAGGTGGGLVALVMVALAAFMLLRAVSAEEKRLSSAARSLEGEPARRS